EVFLPLTVGAKVVLMGRDVAVDPLAIARAVERHQVSVMQATPSAWRMLVESGWSGARVLAISGGEKLAVDLGAALVARCERVWDQYGPSETTIYSTIAEVRPGRSSIGDPIANTSVHVLGPMLDVVPTGVPGELCIGGDGLAVGY